MSYKVYLCGLPPPEAVLLPAPNQDCRHYVNGPLGYLQWHEDAQNRSDEGQVQTRCSVCGCWVWSEEWQEGKP